MIRKGSNWLPVVSTLRAGQVFAKPLAPERCEYGLQNGVQHSSAGSPKGHPSLERNDLLQPLFPLLAAGEVFIARELGVITLRRNRRARPLRQFVHLRRRRKRGMGARVGSLQLVGVGRSIRG